ncbi:MAG: tRNA (guanosine(37)-N1)-methyltransferase TrmD [Hydrogenovibrio sp.]|uniref:tRNA (guanosine(37)-N1)-methyltransferase TrmD n=1 Tax=Hydrogenovibrio TaxID=28884 RepID=UPI00036942A9|nr:MULTISPECIES: tRNA (guanosine(37)-N1)-methyltransferase TrmD [Hydrogenovibrio]MDR9498089.1 tRNA (guanosine(37)-N1)-methyltransferase TrmD [Hydrogenovibrio sp.]
MRFDVVSLFPEMFRALTESGVSGRAFDRALCALHHWNPRTYTQDRHRTVDDRPYGGGPGMVMMYPPLKAAFEAIAEAQPESGATPYTVYLSPQGQPLTQARLQALAERPQLTLLCGRYEGVDERVLEEYVDEEIAIGDFVVSGGELPAMMLMDGLIRLLPGALGHNQSAEQDSFSDGLLDCPHYTRPAEVDGQTVPPVLQSGDHARIAQWRQQQKLVRTQQKRPDLYARYQADLKARDNLDSTSGS